MTHDAGLNTMTELTWKELLETRLCRPESCIEMGAGGIEQTLGWSPEQYPSTGKIDFAISQLLAESGPFTLAKRPWEPAAQPGQAA